MDNKKKLIIGGGVLLVLILLFTLTPLKSIFFESTNVDTLIKQAEKYYKLGEYNRALDKLDRAEQNKPTKKQQKQIDELRKRIIEAKSGLTDEDPVKRLIRKAKQSADDDDYETAIINLNKARKINESKEKPNKKDREEINRLLKEYKRKMKIQAQNDNPDELLKRAKLAVREGDFEKARKLVRRARRAYDTQNKKSKRLNRRIKDSNRIYKARHKRQAKTDKPRELINQAKRSAATGNYGTAFKYLRRARRANNARRNPSKKIEREIRRLEKLYNKREREQINKDDPYELVKRAKQYAANEDYETAIAYLKRARRANNAKSNPDKNLAAEIEKLIKEYTNKMRKQARNDNPEKLVKEAQEKAGNGEYTQAIKLLRRARRANLARKRPKRRLTRKINKLEKEYKKRLAEQGLKDNPDVFVKEAKKSAKKGDYDNALKLLKRARRANNMREHPDKKLDKEITELEKEYLKKRDEQTKKDNPYELVKRAKESAAKKDYEKAINLLGRAKRANQAKEKPDEKLAKEIDRLTKLYKRLLLRQARRDNPEKLVKRARKLVDQEDYDNALKLLRRARRANNARRRPSKRTAENIENLEKEIRRKRSGGGEKTTNNGSGRDDGNKIDNRRGGTQLSKEELKKMLEKERKRLAELKKNRKESGQSKTERERKARKLINEGNNALKRGDNDGAIKKFKKALEQDPESAKANSGLGWAYYKKGNNQKAFKYSTRAISEDPNNSRGNLTRGEVFYKNKQDGEAEAAFKKALIRDRNNALALYRLGVIKLIQRKNRTARGYFIRAAKSRGFRELDNNSKYKCYYNLGKANERIRNYNGAITAYNRSVQYDPSNEKPYISMGQIYYLKQVYPSAIKNFKKSLEYKNTYYAHFWLGKCYDAMRNYRSALTHYKKALEKRPENYEARYNLGRAYSKLGQYDNAITHYKQAGDRHGYNSKLLVQLGNAYLGKKNYPMATETYKSAISKNSREAEAYKGISNSLIAQNKITNAIVYLKEGANLTKDSSVYAKLGELYFKIRDYDQAITAFRNALDRSPNNTLYRRLMADVYFAKKDFKSAAEEYEKVISIDRTVWVAYHRLGDAYIEQKMLEAAKTVYKKLINRNPNYSKINIIRRKLSSLQGGS